MGLRMQRRMKEHLTAILPASPVDVFTSFFVVHVFFANARDTFYVQHRSLVLFSSSQRQEFPRDLHASLYLGDLLKLKKKSSGLLKAANRVRITPPHTALTIASLNYPA